MSAPVQVLVVGLESPAYDGTVLEELARLRHAGVVRLIDLMVVRHEPDGAFETVDLPAGAPAGLGRLASAFFHHVGDDGPAGEGTWSLADVVPVGGIAAVALLEHLWAAPLVGVIAAVGGTPLDETWLSIDDRRRLDALQGD
ncbi:MAG: DUF6325 family protein [Candidatus Nanopelagicales bacterium]